MENKNREELAVKTIYSTIDALDILEQIKTQYNFSSVSDCELIQRGNNDTYKVTLDKKNYILRIYRHKWRTEEEINFEIDILEYLKERNIRVSFPIKKNDNMYLTKIHSAEGRRYIALMKFTYGYEQNYKNSDDAYIYGVHVAKLHKASKDFYAKSKKYDLDLNTLLYDSIKTINHFLIPYPIHKKYFSDFSAKLIKKIEIFPGKSLDYGFCHGDLHGGNAHRIKNSIEFFDFDFCGYGWRSYDLAVFRWGCRLRNQENLLWNSYLDGYRSVRRISDLDIEWTKYFLIIRDLWVMALHINNSKYFGTTFVGESYIQKRINFFKDIEKDYL